MTRFWKSRPGDTFILALTPYVFPHRFPVLHPCLLVLHFCSSKPSSAFSYYLVTYSRHSCLPFRTMDTIQLGKPVVVEVQTGMVRELSRYIEVSPIPHYSLHQPMFRNTAVDLPRDALWTEIKITFRADVAMVVKIFC